MKHGFEWANAQSKVASLQTISSTLYQAVVLIMGGLLGERRSLHLRAGGRVKLLPA
jgi:hypothetical protein